MTSPDTTTPKWPRPNTAPAGAPNIIVFLTDDVGYGACSTFGGPIPTPALDRLAASGLRFTQFHTTAMCSPTRGSLLTGRNPHNVAMGRITNRPTCFDGYTSVIPESAGTVAAALRSNGYGTAMFGKGHITPEWEMSHLGPFDRWPTGLGFDYFYGFLGYDTNMWAPQLVENTTFVEPIHDRNHPRHFDEIMADKAIAWMETQRTLAPEKPFFMYYATGTAHTPHHAPQDWLQRFRGAFDQGWDRVREESYARQKASGVIAQDAVLTPRPDDLPAWDSLSPDQRRLAARLMEAYAAALAHADHHVGRVLDAVRDMGAQDNTLVLFIQGDNGGSAEGGFNGLLFEQSWTNGFDEDLAYLLEHIDDIGGPKAYNHFPAAWGWAMNTPFQYYKQVASHFGGTRNGLVMSWPQQIADGGGVRTQFHFVSDIMATALEAAGVAAPAVLRGVKQDPLDGVSMLYAARNADAPPRRTTQVFECLENYGIYHDGWFAGTRPVCGPWADLSNRKPTDAASRVWELYDIRTDYSQAIDLSAREPHRLAELQDLFWKEAEANRILPIHPPTVGFEGRPSVAAGRKVFTYRRPIERVHSDAAPHTVGKSFSITARIRTARDGGNGVLVAHGSSFNGYAFYLRHGRLAFHYNAIAPHCYSVCAEETLAAGNHEVSAHFRIDEARPTAAGTLDLMVDGRLVASGRIGRTLRTFINQDSFNVGCDTVSPVAPDYAIEDSCFDGELAQVVVTLH